LNKLNGGGVVGIDDGFRCGWWNWLVGWLVTYTTSNIDSLHTNVHNRKYCGVVTGAGGCQLQDCRELCDVQQTILNPPILILTMFFVMFLFHCTDAPPQLLLSLFAFALSFFAFFYASQK
jgi:hypothetical protein